MKVITPVNAQREDPPTIHLQFVKHNIDTAEELPHLAETIKGRGVQ